MLNAILTNWTAQLSLNTNKVPSEKPRTIHETVTENTVKPTTTTQLEVIEVDSVEPATQGNFQILISVLARLGVLMRRLHVIFQFLPIS